MQWKNHAVGPDESQPFAERIDGNRFPSSAFGYLGPQQPAARQASRPRAGVDGVTSGRSPEAQDHASQGRTGDDRHVALRALQGQGLRQFARGTRFGIIDWRDGCSSEVKNRQEHGRAVEHMRRGFAGEVSSASIVETQNKPSSGAHHQLAPIHRVGEQAADEQQRICGSARARPSRPICNGELVNS